MAEDNEKKPEPIFLNQGDIFHWAGPPFASIYRGSTKLIEHQGIEGIDTVIGPYKVIASAVRYLADIERANLDKGIEPTRERFFSGGIIIYGNGQLEGTELQGYSIKRVGEIWTATTNLSAELNQLLFGDAVEEADLMLRVERILAGYEAQDEAVRRAEHARDKEMFSLGGDARESEKLGFGL